jgi:hypothetical protein
MGLASSTHGSDEGYINFGGKYEMMRQLERNRH